MFIKKGLKRLYRAFAPWEDVPKKINAIYRKMDKAKKMGRGIATQYYCHLIEKRYHCRISPGACIGVNLRLPHPDGVVIGEGCKIGKNVTIYQQVTIGQNRGKYPAIGDGVIIYAVAKIVGDVCIGDGSIIGANAVVTKNVPASSIWGGNPARELQKRDHNKEYI